MNEMIMNGRSSQNGVDQVSQPTPLMLTETMKLEKNIIVKLLTIRIAASINVHVLTCA